MILDLVCRLYILTLSHHSILYSIFYFIFYSFILFISILLNHLHFISALLYFFLMKHPYQIVTADQKHLFASVKNHLQVFDMDSGAMVGSWVDTVDTNTPLKKHHEEIAQKMQKNNDAKPVKIPKIPVPGPGAPPIYNYIRSLVLSNDGNYLVGSTDSDKSVIIFKIDYSQENCLQLIKRQVFPKRPCGVLLDGTSSVIVADKFGDVYSIDLTSDPVDEKLLLPILGHVSMLSDVLVTELNVKKFVLSGDRDEHIRVTNYPKAYVVKNWLFGHHEFVSAMAVPDFDSEMLISGGGDDFLCVWKWFQNELVQKVELRPIVEELLLDEHLPPSRFRTDESPREIAVSQIVPIKSGENNFLVVVLENTSALVVFKVEKTVIHAQTFKTSSPVVHICSSGNRIVASLEELKVEIYDMESQGLVEGKEIEIMEKNPCDVGGKEEFYPLFQVNSLRKRSDH